MQLKLRGQGSYLDKYKKLHVAFLDGETKDKVKKHITRDDDCDNFSIPYDFKYFIITIPSIKDFIDEIKNLLGRIVDFYVELKPYQFKSKYNNNYGSLQGGVKLELVDYKIITREDD